MLVRSEPAPIGDDRQQRVVVDVLQWINVPIDARPQVSRDWGGVEVGDSAALEDRPGCVLVPRFGEVLSQCAADSLQCGDAYQGLGLLDELETADAHLRVGTREVRAPAEPGTTACVSDRFAECAACGLRVVRGT